MAGIFQTPQNERSFSSLIDDVIRITGKPASIIDMVSYANATIRECQAFGLIARDLVEDQLTSTAAVDGSTPFIWTRPQWFRVLRAVKYPNGNDINIPSNAMGYPRPIYPKLLLPGRIQKDNYHYFYAADNYFVFKGIQNGGLVTVAYYQWQRPLLYYGRLGTNTSTLNGGPYGVRPGYWDINLNQFMYLSADGTQYVSTTGNPTTDAAVQAISTNWLVAEWRDLILSGTMSKVLTRAGDPRSGPEFAAYKQMQRLFCNANELEATGF